MTRETEREAQRSPASYSADELMLAWQQTGRELLYGKSYGRSEMGLARFSKAFEKARAYFIRENIQPERYIWAIFEHARYVCSRAGVGIDDVLRDAAISVRSSGLRRRRKYANKRVHAADRAFRKMIYVAAENLPKEMRRGAKECARVFDPEALGVEEALREILAETGKKQPSIPHILLACTRVIIEEERNLDRFIARMFLHLTTRAGARTVTAELLSALKAKRGLGKLLAGSRRDRDLHRASRGTIWRPMPHQLISPKYREIYDRFERRAAAEEGHDVGIRDRALRVHTPDVRDFLAVRRSAEIYPVIIAAADAGTHPDGIAHQLQGLSPFFLFFCKHPLAQAHVANGGASPEQRKTFDKLRFIARERSRAAAIYDRAMREIEARGEFDIAEALRQ